MDAIKNWIDTSPTANVLWIILIVLGVIILLKYVKEITRPLLIVIVVAAAVLIFFNVLDMAMLAEYGKRMVSCACSESPSAVSIADALL